VPRAAIVFQPLQNCGVVVSWLQQMRLLVGVSPSQHPSLVYSFQFQNLELPSYALPAPDAAARPILVCVWGQHTQAATLALRSVFARFPPTRTRYFMYSYSLRRWFSIRPRSFFLLSLSLEQSVKPYKTVGLRLRLPTDLQVCKAAHHSQFAGSQN
jgi:hypothetical protein